MKIEREFFRKYKAFDVLPCITLYWGCGPLGVEFSWMKWNINIDFTMDSKTCR